MGLKQDIDSDIKTAMLAGEKPLVEVLRGLKAAILSVEVAKGARETGLPEEELTGILAKEAKKRQESAELFAGGNRPELAAKEMSEKQIIEKYLPAQATENDIRATIDQLAADIGIQPNQMGQLIGAVKAKLGASADGTIIARLVKEKLS